VLRELTGYELGAFICGIRPAYYGCKYSGFALPASARACSTPARQFFVARHLYGPGHSLLARGCRDFHLVCSKHLSTDVDLLRGRGMSNR
jgi:hypothetical protein